VAALAGFETQTVRASAAADNLGGSFALAFAGQTTRERNRLQREPGGRQVRA
jgi:hypothetical protein